MNSDISTQTDTVLETTEKIERATDYIKTRINNFKPSVGIILGSGLGNLADKITEPVKLKYEDIPGFAYSTVEGHAGQLVTGILKDKKVMAMQGRMHYYEGYGMDDITLPVRVMKKLGVEILIITNAAGAVDRNYTPGDLMVIKDHVNFSGINPLRGKNLADFGPRFPDLSQCYSDSLRQLALNVGMAKGMILKEGVYFFSTGPSYETPAEIRVLEKFEVDAVGMSTVPEAIVAAHCGMRVLGISCITNMACGILEEKLSHVEVIETTTRVNKKFISLLEGIIEKL